MEDLRTTVSISWRTHWTFAVSFIFYLLISNVSSQQPQQPLAITMKPSNVTAQLGEPLKLNCVFNQPVACIWQRNGDVLLVNDEETEYKYTSMRKDGEKSPDCSITIAAISDQDFARWRCSTYAFRNSPAVSSDEFWISKQVTPTEPVILFKNKTVSEIKLPLNDPPSHLVCVSQKGNPPAVLSWELNGLPYHGKLEILVEATDLYSVQLGWDRAGDWKIFDNAKEILCKANHSGFENIKAAKLQLKRNYAPRNVKVWAESYGDEEVQIGNDERVLLACISDGQPSPAYTWEVWSPEDESWKLYNNNYEQNITVNIDLVGKYRCKASNDLNKHSPTSSHNELVVSVKKAEVTSTGVIIGIVVGCALLIMILVLIFVYMKRKQKAAPPDKDGHVAGQDGRDPEAVDETTEKTALSEPAYDNVQQNGQDDKLNGKTDTSPIKIDENVNKKTDEVVYAQLDLAQTDTAKVRTPSEPEKTEYAEIRFNQENNHQNTQPA